ncbi:MAG: right-handed parallel beta-helix repeat-containing protein [Deltaproteobacteria bacterium]|nr:right-handed parallel beta-helix repeat-containing protein [Deltaproteobacteria bacterium]
MQRWNGPLGLVVGLLALGGSPAGCAAPEPSAECPPDRVLDAVDADDLGCVVVDCGTGPWGDIEATEDTLFVAPWGDDPDDGGTGTMERPFKRVRDGAAAAADAGGARVGVAAGTYEENIDLFEAEGVELVGRCAERVVIDGGRNPTPTVLVGTGAATLRRLTLTGGEIGVHVVGGLAGSEFLGEQLAILENRTIGAVFESPGGSSELRDTIVRGTLPGPDGDFGRGLYVGFGASLEASGLLVEENLQTGIYVTGEGSTLDLRDSVVRSIQPSAGADAARGLDATRDSISQVRNCVFEGTQGAAIRAAERAVVEVEDTVVSSAPPVALVDMTGIQVQSGARVTARRMTLRENVGHGVSVFDATSRLEISDSTISDTLRREDAGLGFGGEVFAGGTLVASGLVIERSSSNGLLLSDLGTSIDLSDVSIQDTMGLGPLPGWGVRVMAGASLVASELHIEGTAGLGMLVTGDDTLVQLTDASVTGTRPTSDGSMGRGIDVSDHGALIATRLLLDNNTDVGLLIDGLEVLEEGELFQYTPVELYESQVSNTRAGPQNLSAGVVAQSRARLTADDLTITENDGPGIFLAGTVPSVRLTNSTLTDNLFAGVANLGGSINLWDSTVSGTRPHPAEGGGAGVFAHALTWWPSVTLRNVLFTDLPGPALYARGEGIYGLIGCEVTDTGTWPSMPGGVLARDGAGLEVFYHLRIQGNDFHDLHGDAIVLEASAADIDEDYDTGLPNTFSGIPGTPLFVQCGADTTPTTVGDGSGLDPTCRSSARPLGPPLQYFIRPVETDVAE